MKRIARTFVVTTLWVCVSSGARANGRYPIANQLVVSPRDPASLVLRTTFGLVLSQDQGKTFAWVCEKAAGFVNNEDPPIEVTADGTILVASSQALSVSHDGGCAWQMSLADSSIVDADVDPSNPARTLAIASLYLDGGTRSGLEESLDNGTTWHALGVDFEGLPATLAVAPSDAHRVYASGTAGDAALTPLISTSDDDGAHWRSYPLDLEQITVPFLAAIDPAHPELVYVRAPTAQGKDVLVVSHDYGQHFSTIFKANGGLYGFALSPDGSQVAVGGPNDALQVASTVDYAFETVSPILPLCLKWSAAGLYSCADEAKSGFSLGVSSDGGAHFQALFHKPALALKLCPASLDTGKYCPQAWVGEQAALGVDAGTASGGAPTASAGAAAVIDAGLSDASTDSGSAPSVASSPPTQHGGCAFGVQRDTRSARLLALSSLLLGLGFSRRRAHRRR